MTRDPHEAYEQAIIALRALLLSLEGKRRAAKEWRASCARDGFKRTIRQLDRYLIKVNKAIALARRHLAETLRAVRLLGLGLDVAVVPNPRMLS